jgi:hypothetical protein
MGGPTDSPAKVLLSVKLHLSGLYVVGQWSEILQVVFFLLPLYSLAIGGMQGNIYCHPPTSSMVMLLTLGAISSEVVGRFNWDQFFARLVS